MHERICWWTKSKQLVAGRKAGWIDVCVRYSWDQLVGVRPSTELQNVSERQWNNHFESFGLSHETTTFPFMSTRDANGENRNIHFLQPGKPTNHLGRFGHKMMFMQQWNPLIRLLLVKMPTNISPLPVSKLQPPCFLKFQPFCSRCKHDS